MWKKTGCLLHFPPKNQIKKKKQVQKRNVQFIQATLEKKQALSCVCNYN